MKIGVLSDTHAKVDLTRFVVEKLKKQGASFLIHAGDIVKEENLKILKKSGIPYIAVFGNNDRGLWHLRDKYNLVVEPHYFKIKDIKIKLMHHPLFMKPDADILIYGHTHFFDAKLTKKAFFLNSGEVCARKKNLCECVLLEIEKSKYIVNRYTCVPEKLKWQEEVKVFKK